MMRPLSPLQYQAANQALEPYLYVCNGLKGLISLSRPTISSSETGGLENQMRTL